MCRLVPGTFVGYEWLAVDVDRPDWWVQEACLFTIAHGTTARGIAELLGLDVHDRDGSAAGDDPLDELMGEAKAILDADGGWAVLYEDNGPPRDSAERVALDPRVDEAVIVFAGVNSVMRFSRWRDQRLPRLLRAP